MLGDDRDDPGGRFVRRVIDTEQSLLGALLLSAKEAPLLRQAGLLPRFCLRLDHSKILSVAYQLVDRGIDPEPLNVARELDGALDGGAAYVSRLCDGAVRLTPAYVTCAVGLIRTAWQARSTEQRLFAAASRLRGDPTLIGDEFLAELAADLALIRATTPGPSLGCITTAREFASRAPDQPDWVWRPYVARGAVTELDAKVKTGKTTLIAAAVRSVVNAMPFLDYPTGCTPVLWLTEERAATFRETLRRAELLDRDDVAVMSFWDVADQPWPAIAELADRGMERLGAGLLIVDALGQFARLKDDMENNAGSALEAVGPLQRIAAKGRAVLFSRHERKSGGDVGDSGRGSSAFAGAVDVVMALRRPEGKARSTMRVIHALSRFDQTPPALVIERVDITSAHPRGEVWAESFVALGTETLVAVKEARLSLLEDLPRDETGAIRIDDFLEDHPTLKRSSVQRALGALVECQLVTKIGIGRSGSPLRYFKTESQSAQTTSLGWAERNEGTGL